MTIEMPTRKTTTPATTGLQPLPAAPQAARRVGMEAQRLGATLRQIGGQFGDLADRVKRAEVRTEVADEKIAYNEAKDLAILEIEKDPDFGSHADKFIIWHNDYTKSRIEGMKSNEVRAYQNRWFKAQKHTESFAVAARADSRIAKNDIAALRRLVDVGIKTGNFTDAEIQAEAMIADGNLLTKVWQNQLADAVTENKKLEYSNLKRSYYEKAYAILIETRDIEEAVKFLASKEQTPGLLPSDRFTRIRWLREENKYMEEEFDELTIKERIAETDEVVKLFAKRELKPDRVDVIKTPSAKRDWTKRYTGAAKAAKKTTWSAYVDLEDMILKQLTGEPIKKGGKALTREQAQLLLADAVGIDKTITSEDLDSLLSFLDDDVFKKENALGQLKSGFEMTKEIGRTGWRDKDWTWTISKWVDSWRVGDSEAKDIISARKALIEWYKDRISRKKETTLIDVHTKVRELMVTGITVYPKASPETLEAARKVIAEFAAEKAAKKPPENPYKKEYPDAFFEDGIWKVIRDGKKYRIED